MGALVITNEARVKAELAELFALFGCGDPSLGWLFGSEASSLRPGTLVRVTVPLGSSSGVRGTARVLACEPLRRIDLRHETPWTGRVACRFDAVGGDTRVRVRVEIEDREMQRLGWILGLLPTPAEPDDSEVQLGLLVSLSGSAGILGRSTVNCADMAVEEVNADGGVTGRRVRLSVADDATDAALGRLAMRRLLQIPRMAAIIGMHSSATCSAVSPLTVAAGVPYLYTPTSEPTTQHPLLLRFGETPADQLRWALPRLASQTGGSRWFLAGNDYSWPRAIGATARAVVESAGGSVAGERYLPLGTRSFEPLISQIERAQPECIVSSFVGEDQVCFEREFADWGLRDRTRTFAPLMDDAVVEHLGECGSGIWNVLGYFESLDTSENRSFLRRYRQRFGRWAPPVSAAAEGVYEAVHVWADACRIGRGVDATALLSGLGRSRFQGPRRCRAGRARTLLLGETTASGVRVLDEIPAVGRMQSA